MYYAVFVPPSCEPPEGTVIPSNEELVFDDIKLASSALKRFKGSRMKTFASREKALEFLDQHPGLDESFMDLDISTNSQDSLINSLEKLSLQNQSSPNKDNKQLLPPPSPQQPPQADPLVAEAEPAYPSVQPRELNLLRRKIEAGEWEAVDEMIWSNPRRLVTVSDSAVYLMAGPKYNACHIAARSNKPDIMANILDTVSNFSFLRKLYPKESDSNIQDRVNHLMDSYLNTPDPKLGNTPLHFACKLGHYRVVRVLLTFEGCDQNLRDCNGQTAEESICAQYSGGGATSTGGGGGDDDDQKGQDRNGGLSIQEKIKNLFKQQLHLPLFRDQLKKRLLLERRRSRASSQMDSDTSFSDLDDSFILNRTT